MLRNTIRAPGEPGSCARAFADYVALLPDRNPVAARVQWCSEGCRPGRAWVVPRSRSPNTPRLERVPVPRIPGFLGVKLLPQPGSPCGRTRLIYYDHAVNSLPAAASPLISPSPLPPLLPSLSLLLPSLSGPQSGPQSELWTLGPRPANHNHPDPGAARLASSHASRFLRRVESRSSDTSPSLPDHDRIAKLLSN